MKKVLQQKLYLSKEQENNLDSILSLCKEFYNYLINVDKKQKELSGKYLTVIRDIWINKVDLKKLKARKELSKKEISIENFSPNYV